MQFVVSCRLGYSTESYWTEVSVCKRQQPSVATAIALELGVLLFDAFVKHGSKQDELQ
jgi:ABC-type histidine transport system ATPase subunit